MVASSSLVRFAAAATLLAAACTGSESPCLDRTPGVICEVAGNGMRAYNGDGLPAEDTALYLVSRARTAPDGRLILADLNNHMLRAVQADGTIKTIAGTGIHGYAFVGEPAIGSPLENPVDFEFLPNGELVFVSLHDPRVLKIDADGIIRSIAGTGAEGETGDGGLAARATFAEINGLAIGADGAIVVADSKNNRVRVIRGDVVEALAGTGAAGFSGDGGDARDAALSYPTAVTIEPSGSVLIADRGNHTIRRVALDGTISTIAGTGTPGFSGDGGPATSAMLGSPDGIALAPDGSILISDRGNYRIRRIAPDGTISTVAGTGVQGHDGDAGPATDAMFHVLARVTAEGDGLLIADQGNSCIRELVLDF